MHFMRKVLHYLPVVIAICYSIFSSSAYAQENSFTKEQALQLVIKNTKALQLSDEEVSNAFISDFYFNKTAGTQMVYLQQGYKGTAVYNQIKSIAFKGDKVVSNAGVFIKKIGAAVNIPQGIPSLLPINAVIKAASHIGIFIPQNPSEISHDPLTKKYNFGKLSLSKDDITSKLLWVENNSKLVLCWQVKLAPLFSSDYWLINVDATTGEIVSKHNLTIYDNWEKNISGTTENTPSEKEQLANRGSSITSGTYRVIAYPAESINHPGGTPIVVNTPWNNTGVGNPATTLGWHNDGFVDHDSTRGNNVWAREDRAGNNGNPTPGAATVSTTPQPSLSFDFAFNTSSSPTSIENRKFCVTQLFYWNNLMHDISYLYGFDEVSGNFQNSNQNRGGLGNDFVFADAQDGSGTNNANFGTPEDGSNPRMQMFLWASSSQLFNVNSPSSIAGYKAASEGGVSANNAIADKGPITADVDLYATSGLNDGCTTSISPALVGKVALIDRGTCSFTTKIKNAQNAGAVAVIIINNIPGNPFRMTGTDNTITIPSIMITQIDGGTLKSTIQNGQTVNITLKSTPLDGDLDNGIIGHEYTHGISTRLTGGPSNASCLDNAEQMGEGWSDYFALMTTTNWATAQLTDGANPRGIGTYVIRQPNTGSGIRNFPYSTNLSINPWNFSMLATNTGGAVHTIGEIWATVLWDMTWDLIQQVGINPSLYNPNTVGGNSIALKLVTEGMKLQPCRPGFLDGRDAILKADTLLYNGLYSCAIWKAFARRGMGVNAKQGSSDSYTDQTANSDLPSGTMIKTVDKTEAAQNEELTYTFKTSCQCENIAGYTIVDTLPANVTYVSGGTYNSTNRTVTFTVPALSPGQQQLFTLKVRVNASTYNTPTEFFNESVNSTGIPATLTATATGSGAWALSTTRSSSSPSSLFAINPATASNQMLTSNASFLITDLPTLSFWHYFNTEESFDGGTVEISTDNGTSWSDLGSFMTQNPYNSVVGTDSKKGFSGTSGGIFIQTKINLAAFQGKSVKFRFIFSSDVGVGGDGWYIDDILLRSESGVYNIGYLFNSANAIKTSSSVNTTILNAFPLIWGKFTAEKKDRTSLLSWATIQEHNTTQFIIERSSDGEKFEGIGKVNAKGNSSVVSHYHFTDAFPLNGINYYRLRQEDKDGKFSYSAIRSVTFDIIKGDISIYPNPAKDKIAITIKGNNKPVELQLLNATGQLVSSFVVKGEYKLISLPVLAPGVYFVKVTGEEKVIRLVIR